MANKPRYVTVAGQQVPIDSQDIPLVWYVIKELFDSNHEYMLTDAEIAEVITKVCRKDFPTTHVRTHRHKYNRGDYGKIKKRSVAISRNKRTPLPVEKMRSVRTSIKVYQSRFAEIRKAVIASEQG